MAHLVDLVQAYTTLGQGEIDHLRSLTGNWHLIADLSRADLVLWVPTATGELLAVAHARPATTPTAYPQDPVGQFLPGSELPTTTAALTSHMTRWRRHGDGGSRYDGDVAVPVPGVGRTTCAALACRDSSAAVHRLQGFASPRVPVAAALWDMVASGLFPDPHVTEDGSRGNPRVGDGLVVVTADGTVDYTSPNAVAAFHRLGWQGDLLGVPWASLLAAVQDATAGDDGALALVAAGEKSWSTDLQTHATTVSVRTLPLHIDRDSVGLLVMCRDVTELRRRERELMTKEATIREIHHRVKNNLQTVAALLRMQVRRIEIPAARDALMEAIGRIGTISMVHDVLSQGMQDVVDFDSLLDSGLLLAPTGVSGQAVKTHREGTIGKVHATDATALALVVHELVANAVEHGFDRGTGTLSFRATRRGNHLLLRVEDDGVGLPEDFSPEKSGLGLHIVRSLVAGELRGKITWEQNHPTGTVVVLDISLRTDS